MPTPTDIERLWGRPIADEEHVLAALSVVAAMAKSYCRADWTVLPADVDAVVQTATLRFLTHPGQLPMSEAMGGLSVSFEAGFEGFTAGERMILDRHRVKAR